MKKLILLLTCSLLSLSSCKRENSDSQQSLTKQDTASISVFQKKMTVTLPKLLEYSRFDKFKKDGLSVKTEDGKETEDYRLVFHDDKTILNDEENLLKEEGTYQIDIELDGYETTSFSLKINPSTDFSQSIVIINNPSNLTYTVGTTAKIDLTGSLFRLKTSYKNSNSKIRRFDKKLEESDIRLTLNGEDVTGKEYTFNTPGAFKVYIDYALGGWIGNSIDTQSFDIYVRSNSTKPVQYVDNTITSTVDSTDSYEISITDNATEKTQNQPSSINAGYYTPDEVNASFNIQSYGRNSYDNWIYTPSKGQVPFLIVPVIIPGDEAMATVENLSLIQKAFFGNSSDLYFESLHSYYYRSSFGQLDITGIVTDYFDLKSYDSSFRYKSAITENSTSTIAQDAANWARDTLGYDLTDFDSDGDGLIDALWLVYLSSSSSSSAFWAFSYSTFASGNVLNPVVNNYGWAGIDFLNDGFMGMGPYLNSDCDAHVLIHETGHMLGATDYYSYSSTGYDPTGNSLTMSYNSNDHDAYTKMLFGWSTPYIVYDTSKLSIVASQAKKDQLIVIPYDKKKYKKGADGKVTFNMFDEYLVLEYYTDDDLNSVDYDCYQVRHIQGKGIRMLHIDARLGYVTAYGNEYGVTMFDDPDDALTSTSPLIKPITNSESGGRAEQAYGLPSSYNAYDEIRIISADKRFLNTSRQATTSTLFRKNDTFTFASYSASFPNKTSFNNSSSFSYSIKF